MPYLTFLLLANIACGPVCEPHAVIQHGTPAVGAEYVLAAANEVCDLDALTVRWLDSAPPTFSGARVPVTCGVWVDVLRRDPAWDSALAHELGHACLSTTNESDADTWAAAVNAEAQRLTRAVLAGTI